MHSARHSVSCLTCRYLHKCVQPMSMKIWTIEYEFVTSRYQLRETIIIATALRYTTFCTIANTLWQMGCALSKLKSQFPHWSYGSMKNECEKKWKNCNRERERERERKQDTVLWLFPTMQYCVCGKWPPTPITLSNWNKWSFILLEKFCFILKMSWERKTHSHG